MENEVSVQGRVTIDNSGEMRRALSDVLRTKPKPVTVTVDLSSVSYIDTSGLATLLEAMRIARRQGTRLVLRGVHGQTRDFFEISHMDWLFEVEVEESGA